MLINQIPSHSNSGRLKTPYKILNPKILTDHSFVKILHTPIIIIAVQQFENWAVFETR